MLKYLECLVFNMPRPCVHPYTTVLMDKKALEGGLDGRCKTGGGIDTSDYCYVKVVRFWALFNCLEL